MGLKTALKLCNPVSHRHPPRSSSLPPLTLKRSPAGGGSRSPPHAEQRSPRLSGADECRGTPEPHTRLRGTLGARSRLKQAGGGSPRPPLRAPSEHGRSQGGRRRGEPNLPARGLSLAQQRVPRVRARRAKCSQTPALPRRLDAPGSSRSAAAAAAQRSGAGFSGGSGRPTGNRALGEHRRELGGRDKGDRARGACCFPAQERSEGESSTDRQRFSWGVWGGEPVSSPQPTRIQCKKPKSYRELQ